MKAIRVVTIDATFPELKTGAMYQTGRGEGSTVRAAFAAAGRDLFKQKKLKAKRFTMFKATVSIGTRPTEETPNVEDGSAQQNQG
jgi:hypothetical protein